jgi:hypothetical protein
VIKSGFPIPTGVDRRRGSLTDAPPEIVDDRFDVGAVEPRLEERDAARVVEQGKAALELGLVDRAREAARGRDAEGGAHRLHLEWNVPCSGDKIPGHVIPE